MKVLLTIAALALFVPFQDRIQGQVIAVPNGSFEMPVYSDGSGLLTVSSGIFDGWNFTDAAAGQFGIINPDDSRFPGTSGASGFLPSPADGLQYGVLGTAAGETASITNVSPLATIGNTTTYTLSVAVGNETALNYSSFMGTLQIALLANSTVISSNSIAYSTIPHGEFELLSTSFSSNSEPFTVGEALNIQIAYTAGPKFGDNGIFDNVQLSAVPEPNTSFLFFIGLIFVLMFYRKAKALKSA